MFTFSEMLALVHSQSSFGAYVCHRRSAGLHSDQRSCQVYVCHRGHCKTLSRCRLVGICVRLDENFFLYAYDIVCMLDTVTGNLADISIFITIRSMTDMRASFTSFHSFETLLYNYSLFYHGDQKISCGESAMVWRSTSNSTCVVPA